ncbi:hypothetical protein ACRALDRAFT_1091617 [Sodiomyces alcalophilus JCM 7366]|uniref:uncharacterized protein n=1 Tax=Sodiomyces alcalophilus JCM 7366 TaxID=591952 RepID=UPI0039B6696B
MAQEVAEKKIEGEQASTWQGNVGKKDDGAERSAASLQVRESSAWAAGVARNALIRINPKPLHLAAPPFWHRKSHQQLQIGCTRSEILSLVNARATTLLTQISGLRQPSSSI